MSATTDEEPTAENVLADRRRPGRPDAVSSELIGLLRASELQKSIAEAEAELDGADVDQLSTMRGVVWGVGLSLPAWIGIAAVGRWLLN